MDANVEAPSQAALGEHYGFRRNPYDPSPLGMGEPDSAIFVGRAKEGRELRTLLASFDSGGFFVEGGIGVGKTSFVNVQEYRARREPPKLPLLPTLQPIQLASALSPAEFLLSVLSNLLDAMGRLAPQLRKTPAFRRLSLSVNQSLIETRGWQIGVAGFGGGTSKEVTVSNPPLVLLPVVSGLLDGAAELARKAGFERFVVNVNNLDLIDPQTFVSFLDLARDLTLTRSSFVWIFIGPLGSRSELAHRSRRTSELVRTDPIWLPPLSVQEIHEAIDARTRAFRTSAAVEAPISREVIDLLYEASSGELRYILNRCSDLLVSTMIEFPTAKELNLKLATPLLRELTMRAIERCNLTQKQRAVLTMIANKGPCQPRDHRGYGFRSAPGFVRHLLLFYRLGLVDRRRRGEDVVYTPRGDVKIALSTST